MDGSDVSVDGRIELALVGRIGDGARVSDVIRSVSRDFPPALVRVVYWELVAGNVISRSADGCLRVV